jgi:fluoroquinolone resistance protein
LNGAIFDNTIVEGADFRTADGYSLDPIRNYITAAKFSQENLVGLVAHLNIELQ